MLCADALRCCLTDTLHFSNHTEGLMPRADAQRLLLMPRDAALDPAVLAQGSSTAARRARTLRHCFESLPML